MMLGDEADLVAEAFGELGLIGLVLIFMQLM